MVGMSGAYCGLTTSNRNKRGDASSARYHCMHPRYKTVMCESFELNGVCNYGRKCMFAHGKNELNTSVVESNESHTEPSNCASTMWTAEQTDLCISQVERHPSPLVPGSVENPMPVPDIRVVRRTHWRMGSHSRTVDMQATPSRGSNMSSGGEEAIDMNVGEHDLVVDGTTGVVSVRRGPSYSSYRRMGADTVSLGQLEVLGRDIASLLSE